MTTIPNMVNDPSVVGELLYGTANRYIMASAIGRELASTGIFNQSIGEATEWLGANPALVRTHLNAFAKIGLLEKVAGVRSSNRSPMVAAQYVAVDSPTWNVIGATMQAVDPADTAPSFDNDVFGRVQARSIQKTLFSRTSKPLIGMFVAGRKPTDGPFCAADFQHNDAEHLDGGTVSKTLSDFLRLGMVEVVEIDPKTSRVDYLPTDSALLDTFNALSQIIPAEMQISRLGRSSARGLVVRP